MLDGPQDPIRDISNKTSRTKYLVYQRSLLKKNLSQSCILLSHDNSNNILIIAFKKIRIFVRNIFHVLFEMPIDGSKIPSGNFRVYGLDWRLENIAMTVTLDIRLKRASKVYQEGVRVFIFFMLVYKWEFI